MATPIEVYNHLDWVSGNIHGRFISPQMNKTRMRLGKVPVTESFKRYNGVQRQHWVGNGCEFWHLPSTTMVGAFKLEGEFFANGFSVEDLPHQFWERVRLSRVDVAWDVRGVPIKWFETVLAEERLVTRLRSSSDHRNGGIYDAVNGFGFGSGEAWSARVYDKVKDDLQKGFDRYSKYGDVTRVELQIRRDTLKQFGLGDRPDFAKALAVGRKLIRDDFKVVEKRDKSNVTRSRFDPVWGLLVDPSSDVVRRLDLESRSDAAELVKQAGGCLMKAYTKSAMEIPIREWCMRELSAEIDRRVNEQRIVRLAQKE